MRELSGHQIAINLRSSGIAGVSRSKKLLRNAVDLPVEHVANELDLGLSSSDTLGGRRLRATAHAKERHLGQKCKETRSLTGVDDDDLPGLLAQGVVLAVDLFKGPRNVVNALTRRN